MSIFWRVVLLLVAGVSLYALAPTLLEVFSSWRQLAEIQPWWIVGMIVFYIDHEHPQDGSNATGNDIESLADTGCCNESAPVRGLVLIHCHGSSG